MASKTVIITSNAQLATLVKSNKTVVLDFHATWCGPCKIVAPVFEKLSNALSTPGKIVFAKCDVDAAQEVAAHHSITSMPTFLIFKEGSEVKRIQGANVPELSAAVQQIVDEFKNGGSSSSGGSNTASGPSAKGWWGASLAKGYSDISDEIEKTGLDIMNADGNVRTLFEESEPRKDSANKKDWVESDTDEQLMIFVPFRSTLKIHSIHITSTMPVEGDDDEEIKRPKKIKFYTNRSNILGFDEAEGVVPTQTIELTEDNWDKKTGTTVINTRFVKFQSVFSLTIFVEEGEDGCEKTKIDRIRVVGEVGEKRDLGKLEKAKDGHD